MTDHAVYAPSSAARWLDKCPASARIAAKSPKQPSSPEAEEGTRVHDVIHRALTRGQIPNDPDDKAIVDAVQRYLANLGPGNVDSEMRVTSVEGCVWGTLDVAHDGGRVATLLDYKNGGFDVDVIVNGEDLNAQVMTYADAYGQRHNYKFEWYRLVIFQPNSRTRGEVAPFKQIIVSRDAVLEHHDKIVRAVQRGEGGEAPKPGPHCRYCPAFGTCEKTLDIMVLVLNSLAMPVTQIPDAALVAYARTLRGLIDYKKMVDQELGRRMLVPGKTVPGVTQDMTPTHRKWKDDFLVTKLLWDAYGAQGVKAVTPAQAEGLGPQGKQIAAQMAFKPPGRIVPKY